MQHEYEQEQRQYWERLRQELERYKAELGATNIELAQCLGISRQPLVSFMQGDRVDLPINRSHLKRLWYQLTDPTWMQDKKLSAEERRRRDALRQSGANSLLTAAGFVPDNSTRSIDVEPDRYQHIQRIVLSLTNVPDFIDFIRSTDSLETQLMTRFHSSKDESKSLKNEMSLSWRMSTKDISKWVRKWSKQNLRKLPESSLQQKFERAIAKLVTSGKYDLEDAEIFELYISILENHRLNQNTPDALKLKITQCQFTTLTFSLLGSALNCSEAIKKQLQQAGFNAEKELRCFAEETDYIESIVSDVVLEASVTCRFKDQDEMCWRYSSSATHFENMLAAIARGMGYENKLELVDLSIHSLGSSDSSLIKVSITFKDNNIDTNKKNIFKSVWVDRSAITGTAKSVSFAITNWLLERLPDTESIRSYCDTCQTLATIDYDLNYARQALSDYVIRRPEQSISSPVRDFLTSNIIDKIEHLKATALKQYPILLDWYGTLLEQRYCMAKLWCAHSACVEGDLKAARTLLTEVESFLKQSVLNQCVPLHLLIDTEKMLYQFYSGDRNFFAEKAWRSQLKQYLKQLKDYIYQERDVTFKKYCDRLEFDIYLCASELFGRIGRLDFSLSGWNDSEYLEQAIDHLLMAAYCAAKIGNKQRAAHWITTVSRVYCRLGNDKQARGFADIAAGIIKTAINQQYSSDYKESIMAEVNLANGERCLLVEKNYLAALRYFLMALKGATYISFTRVITESLYGIARASKELRNSKIEKTFEAAFDKSLGEPLRPWRFETDKQKVAPNAIATHVIGFINQLDKRNNWSSVSDQFRDQAKRIWRNWAVAAFGDEAIHPIEAEMESECFLNRVG